jgi:hypothetical protein
MKKTIFFTGAMLCIAPLIFAQSSDNSTSIAEEAQQKTRPALQEDVLGEWEMIWQLNSGTIPDDDPFVSPYLKIYFDDNNHFVTLGSNKPFDDVAVTTWKFALENPGATTYEFVKPGVARIKSSDPPYYIVISAVTEDLSDRLRSDAPLLKKNDLMLSYPRPGNEIYLVRYIRRIDSP